MTSVIGSCWEKAATSSGWAGIQGWVFRGAQELADGIGGNSIKHFMETLTSPCQLFVHCLDNANCPTFHIKSYGDKLPLTDPFLSTEPAEVDHPLAHLN